MSLAPSAQWLLNAMDRWDIEEGLIVGIKIIDKLGNVVEWSTNITDKEMSKLDKIESIEYAEQIRDESRHYDKEYTRKVLPKLGQR
jgi:hypothetical protein